MSGVLLRRMCEDMRLDFWSIGIGRGGADKSTDRVSFGCVGCRQGETQSIVDVALVSSCKKAVREDDMGVPASVYRYHTTRRFEGAGRGLSVPCTR